MGMKFSGQVQRMVYVFRAQNLFFRVTGAGVKKSKTNLINARYG